MGESLLAATVIGSWSLPGWYEKFIGDVGSHPDLFGPVDREEAVRDAVRLAIDDQLRAGLDRISDGEMQRVDFNLGFYEYLGGRQFVVPATGVPLRTTSVRGSAVCSRRSGNCHGIPPAQRVCPGAGKDAGSRAVHTGWPHRRGRGLPRATL
ncbi:MAG: hypothetical protein ABSH35_14870 [Isosphaeraceae bacterium]